MSELERAEALWNLYRRYRQGVWHIPDVKPELVETATGDGAELLVISRQGFEAHGDRAVWLHHPWCDEGGAYAGFELKGINGRQREVYETESGPYRVIVGGQRFDWAKQEYDTSVALWRLGVRCQRPVALFRVTLAGVATSAGVIVRVTSSPIRLIDLWTHPFVADEYLDIVDENRLTWAERLGETLGKSVATALRHGVAKPVEIDNTSSEGELIDFEHVWNGWFWGEPMERGYVHETIYPMFRELPLVLGEAAQAFDAAFTRAFCGATWKCPRHELAARAAEAFVGRPLDEDDLLAPVTDSVRQKLLDDWTRAVGFYRLLQEQHDGLSQTAADGPRQQIQRQVDTLLAITYDDMQRMRRRRRKVVSP